MLKHNPRTSPMNAQPPTERRPLLPLLLLHLAAAGVCFAFFTVVPIVGCFVVMAIGNDPGGPMFFLFLVLGALFFAFVITVFLTGAAFLSDLLRRHYHVPVWLPPLVVFVLTTVSCWPLVGILHPAVPLMVGGIVSLAFVIHWAAISTVWFLPRLLFRMFHVRDVPPKG
jgi:hypothetical protein